MVLDEVLGLKQAVLRGDIRSERSAAAIRPPFAVGVTHVDGDEYRLAVRIESEELRHLPEVQELIARSGGDVDIRVTGHIVPLTGAAPLAVPWPRTVQRPLRIGCSVGAANDTGSLGFFARRADNTLGFVSNNHVVANENQAPMGMQIIQPGTADGGSQRVGRLLDRELLRSGIANLIDGAFVATAPDVGGHDSLLYDDAGVAFGRLAGTRPRIESGPVMKIGRSTGFRRGIVTAFAMDNVTLDYPHLGTLVFDDQIEIESVTHLFANRGDSGAVVFDRGFLAVGLLFAAGDGLAYANQIGNVERLLEVRLIP